MRGDDLRSGTPKGSASKLIPAERATEIDQPGAFGLQAVRRLRGRDRYFGIPPTAASAVDVR